MKYGLTSKKTYDQQDHHLHAHSCNVIRACVVSMCISAQSLIQVFAILDLHVKFVFSYKHVLIHVNECINKHINQTKNELYFSPVIMHPKKPTIYRNSHLA